MGKLDLRTEREKQIEKRHSEIIEMYEHLKSTQPLASDHRIMNTIAKKFNLTVMGVRYILQKQTTEK